MRISHNFPRKFPARRALLAGIVRLKFIFEHRAGGRVSTSACEPRFARRLFSFTRSLLSSIPLPPTSSLRSDLKDKLRLYRGQSFAGLFHRNTILFFLFSSLVNGKQGIRTLDFRLPTSLLREATDNFSEQSRGIYD